MLNKNSAKQLARSGSACPDTGALIVRSIFEDQAEDPRVKPDALWNPVTDDAHMSQVIFLLATSTRRVPVVDKETKRVTHILSQSLVTHVLNETLKELEARGEQLPELFTKTPKNSGGFGIRSDILCVDADENVARDAFRMIIENGVSAVAVLSEGTTLLSSITTKDIRLFKSLEEAAMQRLTAEQRRREAAEDNSPKDHLALMDLTCGDFVSMVELTAANTGMTPAPVVRVNENTTIRKIISLLALTKKHRVFVCDNQKHPIGVISVSDIAKLLVTDPNKKD
jgi:CBS domain-containing protein